MLKTTNNQSKTSWYKYS